MPIQSVTPPEMGCDPGSTANNNRSRVSADLTGSSEPNRQVNATTFLPTLDGRYRYRITVDPKRYTWGVDVADVVKGILDNGTELDLRIDDIRTGNVFLSYVVSSLTQVVAPRFFSKVVPYDGTPNVGNVTAAFDNTDELFESLLANVLVVELDSALSCSETDAVTVTFANASTRAATITTSDPDNFSYTLTFSGLPTVTADLNGGLVSVTCI